MDFTRPGNGAGFFLSRITYKKAGVGLTFGHDLDRKAGSGLTFGHDLDSQAAGTRWHLAMLIAGETPLQVATAEIVSDCQT